MPRAKKNRYYFTKVHEDAIVEYAKTKDIKIRTELYVELIQPAFNEMVDKIIFTYKFNTLPNIDELRDECKIWLTTILDKFDPEKGSKAFSYFSVITKNWFIHKVKRNAKMSKRNISFEEIHSINPEAHSSLVYELSYDQERDEKEFWLALRNEMDSWDISSMKDTEHRVFQAIIILLDSIEDIEIFNKKAIYLYLREITGLNTKQIVRSLNKFREKYKVFKHKWDNGEISLASEEEEEKDEERGQGKSDRGSNLEHSI